MTGQPHTRARGNRYRPRDLGVWEPLRELRRRMKSAQNHPHYIARGNEQPLLQDLMAEDDDAREHGPIRAH